MDEELKAVLLEKLKPGVQIIDELAPYAGHLVSVADEGDRIGIRAGNYSRRGWAREELFHVEEEGRIIGDIAWEFKNITSATAKSCNDSYLVIEGGGLCLSGDTPAESSPGYHQNGILVQRSRTIIRDQWVGLESGRQDNSLEPRSGFRNISVEGREQGVRLIHLPDPTGYDVRRDGAYDGSRLKPNCSIICDSVQLEELTPRSPGDGAQTHLLIGGETALEYADPKALYAKIRFSDCESVSVYLGNCIASAFFERCTVNIVTAPGLRGELVFSDCRFQPDVEGASSSFYTLKSALGTRFTNCTVHAPIVGGEVVPGMVNRIGFLEINKSVQHYHLNTALGNEVLEYFEREGMAITPAFFDKIRSHYGRESHESAQ